MVPQELPANKNQVDALLHDSLRDMTVLDPADAGYKHLASDFLLHGDGKLRLVGRLRDDDLLARLDTCGGDVIDVYSVVCEHLGETDRVLRTPGGLVGGYLFQPVGGRDTAIHTVSVNFRTMHLKLTDRTGACRPA